MNTNRLDVIHLSIIHHDFLFRQRYICTDDGECGILVNVDDKRGGTKTNMMFDFSESIGNNIAEFVEKTVSKYYGSSSDRFHLIQKQVYIMCGHYFISVVAKGGSV